MIKKIALGLVLMAFIGVQACKTDKVSKVELPQEMLDNDWDKAMSLAQEKNKPIYVEFYASWCKYCKKFKENTLNDPGVKDYLAKNYIPVVIDVEKGKGVELKKRYKISSFPTHLVVDKEGVAKGTNYGNIGPDDFMTWIKSVR